MSEKHWHGISFFILWEDSTVEVYDIDLLLHVDGNKTQRHLLENWLDGWSRALAKTNFLHTGYNTVKLLDVHYITDKDIERGGPFAAKINSTIDPATPLRIRE